ncbi:hypothetical protein OIU85_004817 [Salix viminalis]|uniref:Protein kinase domain-containing protein n=1 Tax=Salix viminalis TaxID=40686 RepID=A0A9Q0SYJ6_SALVM|nr:hypothetical protein OIU85_004817 [Salix viminalis]
MLTTINPNDLIGNAGLCGGVLPPCSTTSSASKQHENLRIKHVITGFIIGVSIILTLGIAFCIGKMAEGLGIVYKAEAHRPHAIVAVKKLWRIETDLENGDDLFREVGLLGRLRHRNIVRLLGYLQNETDVLMVYEYMPNGNLGTALHGKEAGNLLVDWNETVSMVAGSYGYIAPDPAFEESVDIVEWVRRKIRNNRALEEALDHSIAGQCKHVQEEMLLVLRIAILCTAKLPKDRPSMRDVITMLGEAKPRRKSICHNNVQNPGEKRSIFSTSPVIGLL